MSDSNRIDRTYPRRWRDAPGAGVGPACLHCGATRDTVGSYNGARAIDVAEGRVVCCSITLSVNSASGGFSGTPSTGYADRDGFGFFSYQSLAAAATAYWFGSYTAIA